MMTGRDRPTRRAALGLIGGALAAPRAAFANRPEAVTGAAFGTGWRILAPAGRDVAALRPGLDALFARIDAQLSPWRPDSVISRFNAGPAGAVMTDPALRGVTRAALAIAARSEGAFDPTVGPLVARWGFGPIRTGGAPDWRAITAGPDGVAKARADLTLDLCGIAKGWALDRAAALARAAGHDGLLLELGGEFFAIGHHPNGRDWRVGVQSPELGRPDPVALRLPPDMAVATSGLRAQGYNLAGRRYGHIIDPATRSPATGGLRSVTVAAGDAMTADGWATALFAAGAEAGPDIAATEGVAALFLIADRDALRQVRTGAMADLIL